MLGLRPLSSEEAPGAGKTGIRGNLLQGLAGNEDMEAAHYDLGLL